MQQIVDAVEGERARLEGELAATAVAAVVNQVLLLARLCKVRCVSCGPDAQRLADGCPMVDKFLLLPQAADKTRRLVSHSKVASRAPANAQALTECETTLAALKGSIGAAGTRCQLVWMVWAADAWAGRIAAAVQNMDWWVPSASLTTVFVLGLSSSCGRPCLRTLRPGRPPWRFLRTCLAICWARCASLLRS